MVTPPPAAVALLGLILPDGGIKEGVLGDLQEMFTARADGPGGHRGRARRWYWGQALRLSVQYGGKRLMGFRFGGFGGVTGPADMTHEAPGLGEAVSGAIRQIRFALRSLLHSPTFTIPALVILATGMTAATAIFTVVDSVVFRPLDIPESHRLVIVCEEHARVSACIASPGNIEDFRQGSETLSELGFARGWPFSLTDESGTQGVRGGLMTAGFMRALQVTPVVGRMFTDDEFGPDNDKIALLSHGFWTTRYGRDPSVVGSSVRIDGNAVEIVGVLPPGFDPPFVTGVQLWMPPHFSPLSPDVRGWRGFRAVGRLADGANLAAASAELTGIYAGIAERHEEVDAEWRLRVQPLLREVVGDSRPVMLAFLAAAGLLLLIVCANVANLLLARGLARREEFAVRAALGAGRARLVRGVLTESLVLSGLASIIALVLSGAATRTLLAMAPPGIPRLDEVATDGRVFLFALALAAVTTVAFGALPALRVTGWHLAPGLKGRGRSGDGLRSTRMQSGLLMAELALSVVLLSSAALLTRSFLKHLEWDPGFDPESLIAVSAFLDAGKYDTRAEFMSVFQQAEAQLAAVPGVTRAATASAGPLFGGGDGATSFAANGAEVTGPLPAARWFDIGPSYFQALGLPIREGREFTEGDGADMPRVAVVNERFATTAWPGESALGKTVQLPELELSFEIIGVAADVPPMTPGEAAYPEIYWSNRQLGRLATFFLVRASGDPAALTEKLKEALLVADPTMSIGTPRTLSTQAERELIRPRFQAMILLTFAAVALLLSAIGVYAVVSYAVARRTREVGIRVALGASGNDVLGLMVRSNIVVAVLGITLGLVGALGTGRLIRSLVPGVSPTDPVSLTIGCVTLALVTAVAVLVPALKATRVDPLMAMRGE